VNRHGRLCSALWTSRCSLPMTSTRLPPSLSPHDQHHEPSSRPPPHPPALHTLLLFCFPRTLCIIIPSPALESKLRSPLAMYHLHPVILSAHHWHDNTSLGELASHPTLRTSNLLTLIQPSLSASLNHRIAAQSLIAVNLCICIDTPESIFCLCLGNDVEAFILINSRAYFKVQGTYFWT
jgi:hypothetical protein